MQKFYICIVAIALSFFVAACSADSLNIYEKPDTKSKVIATVKSGESLVPIFYTEKKDWVKVANPKNGEVGWIKVSEIKGPIIATTTSQTFVPEKDGNAKDRTSVYGIVQFDGSNTMKPEEIKKAMDDLEKRRGEMQQSMQKVQDDMQKALQEMFTGFDKFLDTFPVIQPVVTTTEPSEKK